MATTPSSREGTALLVFVKVLERQKKTNQTYLKFISEIIMIKAYNL